MTSRAKRNRPSRRPRRVRLPKYVIATGIVVLTLGVLLGCVLVVVFFF